MKARLLLLPTLAALGCARSLPLAVIPRYIGPLTEAETRSIGTLPYSPSDVAVAWLADDSLLLAHMEIYRAIDAVAGTCGGSGFYKVSAHGGEPRPIALGEPACLATRTLPAASADGASIVFAVPASRGVRFARMDLAALRTDTLRTGCDTHRYPALSRGGAVAWSGCVLGEDGIHVWRPGDARARRISGSGQVDTRFPSWAPDGARVAYSVGRGTRMIALADTTGTSRVLEIAGDAPAWSPDGRSIAYLIDQEYPCLGGIGMARADGSDAHAIFRNEVTTTYSVGQGPAREGQTCGPLVWSPDSSALIFPRYFVGGESLWRLDVRSGKLQEVTSPAR